MTHTAVTKIPFLGSGLGYRRELREALFESRDSVDFLEIITDQYIDEIDDEKSRRSRLKELEEICEIFPVIPHGIGLSVGSISPPDWQYLRAIKVVSDITQSPYYSEHLCMTRAPGIDIGHLSPLWFTEEVLVQTVENVARTQDYLRKPLVLENVTYLFDIPNGSMSQTEFFHRLVEATGCGILLDVTNIYINSVNHGFEPVVFLNQMPLEKVVQVHLAGGYWSHEVLVDGHSELVQEESWSLLEVLAEKVPIRASILEHDANFPENPILLFEQVGRARQIIAKSRAHL